MRQRVVLTGIGIVGPTGMGVRTFWNALSRGESPITRIRRFDASGLSSQIAGQVPDFNLSELVGTPIKSKRLSLASQFGVAAAFLACQDADLDPSTGHVPLSIGSATSSFDVIERGWDMQAKRRNGVGSPLVCRESSPQAISTAIARTLGIRGPSVTLSSACRAGIEAVWNAAQMIAHGEADVAVTGGADSVISLSIFSSLAAAGLCSTCNAYPHLASRPFDLKRDTGVVSEGAAILVLESYEHALARGATPYLEIVSRGSNIDGPDDESGLGLGATMQAALDDAGMRLPDVDYICAHGPGHPAMDRLETRLLKQVFGRRAYEIPVSSIKGTVGNPMAAAGPMQVAACAMAFRHNLIPPTANYVYPDPECDLDYVAMARQATLRSAMINAHGIGGGNTTLIVRHIEALKPLCRRPRRGPLAGAAIQPG